MKIEELVKMWWESSDNCSNNCSLCFSQLDCPNTTKLICKNKEFLSPKSNNLLNME